MKRMLRVGIVALGLGLAALPTPALAWQGEVSSGGANLRYGVWDTIIGQLPGGSRVEVLGDGWDASGNLWHRVQTSYGTIGWVYGSLINSPGDSSSSSSGGAGGTATWYGDYFHGRPMANGQIFNMWDPTTTAANAYPLGTWLRVTNQLTGASVVVQVRDTGAFDSINPTTLVDLSYAAFAAIADPGQGRIPVTVTYA